jgi:SAM-dependent methyltransferase
LPSGFAGGEVPSPMPLADTSAVQPDRTIAPGDGMLTPGREEEYFALGRRALELVRFSGELCDKPHYERILDLPCGHGRVLRWLQAHYHYARIVACDLDAAGVAFCRERFGAVGVVSRRDLSRVEFDTGFDLVWCGSLLTHLPPEQWPAVMDCFERWTAECGVIVLTLQGRIFTTLLARGQRNLAENIDKARLLRNFAATGAAFEPYCERPDEPYGVAVASPEFVGRWLQRYPHLILRAYLEQAWGVQDVAILYKATGYNEPILGGCSRAVAPG